MVCPKCGKVIEDGSGFCRYCGTVFAEYLPQITRSAPVSSVPVQPVSAQQPVMNVQYAPAAAKKKTRLPLIIGISAAAVVVIAAVIVLLIVFRIETVTDMDYDLPYGNKTISGKYTGTIQLGKPQGKGEFSFTDNFTCRDLISSLFGITFRNDYVYSGEFKGGVMTDTDKVTVDMYMNSDSIVSCIELEGDFREMKPYDCTFAMKLPEDEAELVKYMFSDGGVMYTGKVVQGKVEIDDTELQRKAADIAKMIPGVSEFVDWILDISNSAIDSVTGASLFSDYGIFEF